MTDRPVVRRVANRIEAHPLATPVRLLVDAHRPLAPLLADVAAAMGPLIEAALGRSDSDLRTIAQDPAGLDELVEELDRAAARGAGAVAG